MRWSKMTRSVAVFLMILFLVTPSKASFTKEESTTMSSISKRQANACYFGSSNSAASNYPPTSSDCGLTTGETCYLRKVKDIDFYEMGCQPQTSCDRNAEQVESGVDLTYESYQCCKDSNLCNDYQDFQEDGSGDSSDGASLNRFAAEAMVVVLLCQLVSFVASEI
jgi:hypothetical protein